MKKLSRITLPMLAVLLLTLTVNAQTVPKGGVMVGGSAGVTSVSNDGNTDVSFFLEPTAGFFVIDDLAVGATLGVGVSESVTQFSVGPFVRYYFVKSLFAQAGLDFTSTKFDGFDSSSSTRFNIALGYSAFLNDGLALEPALVFDFGDGVTVIGLSIGFQGFLNR